MFVIVSKTSPDCNRKPRKLLSCLKFNNFHTLHVDRHVTSRLATNEPCRVTTHYNWKLEHSNFFRVLRRRAVRHGTMRNDSWRHDSRIIRMEQVCMVESCLGVCSCVTTLKPTRLLTLMQNEQNNFSWFSVGLKHTLCMLRPMTWHKVYLPIISRCLVSICTP